MENLIRLQKYLADCGIASRRKCEELIQNGFITVNGKKVTQLGSKINPTVDIVKYNNKIVKANSNKIYILLNKPAGYVTTAKDQFNRKTVFDLVNVSERIVPVGRLDMFTSGALLLSNDGDFVYKYTHPKHEVEKTYVASTTGQLSVEDLKKLSNGVEIICDDKPYITKPAKVKLLKYDKEKNISRVEVIIHEGKNRQVRKMFEAIDKKVLTLHRTQIGNISVKNLRLGQWKYLSENELKSIEKNL